MNKWTILSVCMRRHMSTQISEVLRPINNHPFLPIVNSAFPNQAREWYRPCAGNQHTLTHPCMQCNAIPSTNHLGNQLPASQSQPLDSRSQPLGEAENKRDKFQQQQCSSSLFSRLQTKQTEVAVVQNSPTSSFVSLDLSPSLPPINSM